MSFSGDTDEAESAKISAPCPEAGVNFFDTADQYNKGRSEGILGGLMRGHRDELVVAIKCFNPAVAACPRCPSTKSPRVLSAVPKGLSAAPRCLSTAPRCA
jgi:aryl-alcohol dehydrogenase-like predicted oxidoreductase